jgi:hypothetical protein
MMSEQKDMKTGVSGSLHVNNMNYKLPKSLTNTVASTSTQQKFQKRNFRQNETARCIISTGSDFVDWEKSFLFMRVKLIADGTEADPGDVGAGFGVGSAMNMISSIKVSSRSGVELSRMNRANFINNVEAKWNHTQEYLDSVGSAAGFGSADDAVTADVETSFAIPCSMLMGFFKPSKGITAPPQMASGLDIEFLLASVGQAFHEDAAGETGKIADYEITDMYFHCTTQTKQDSIARAIAKTSSSAGLVYMYDKVFSTTNLGLSGSTTLEVDVSKSASFGKRATTVAYVEANQSLITEDSFVTLPYNYTSVQTRVGSVYLPLQALSSGLDSGYGSILGFLYSQNAYDTDKSGNSVTLADYKSGLSGSTCVSASLEKSSDLQLSGLSLNNSRRLNVSLEFDSLGSNCTFLTYVKYTAVSSIFLNNVSAKE